MAVELLARVRAEIEQRLADLRPAVAEYEQLIGATDALGTDPTDAIEPAGRAASAKTAPPAKATTPAKTAPPAKATTLAKAVPRARAARPAKRVASAKRAKPPGAAEQAIAAALEHGSHTVAELVLVSALPAAEIRAGLRPLLKSGAVTRAKRDGKAAYALSSPT